MKRVCSIAYSDYAGDPRVRRLAEALAVRGDEVDCLSLRAPGAPAEEWVDGVRVVRLNQARYRGQAKARYLWAYVTFLVRVFFTLTSRHRDRRYDVIHVNNVPNFLVFAALVPRLQGARVVLDMHDTLPERFASTTLLRKLLVWEERLSTAFAHRVCCVHDLQQQTLISRGVPVSKIRVVMNLPDERIWIRPASADDVRPEPMLLVFHGDLSADVHVDAAIDALSELRDKMPNLRLRVLGTGDEFPRLRKRVEDHDLLDRVEMTGESVSVEDLPHRLADADVGVIPSHDEGELPAKLMEYAMLGMSVIAPRTRVIAHYFGDDMLTFIEPGDADGLTAAIWDLAGDPALRRRRAANLRRFADAHAWSHEKEIYFDSIDGDSGGNLELPAA